MRPLLLALALAAPAAPPPPAAPSLRELRLDAADAVMTERWGRLYAVAGRLLELDPLDADAYRLAGSAAALGGRREEAARLLRKAQLILSLEGTEELLSALEAPLGPPAPGEAEAVVPPPRVLALALLEIAANRHLALRPVTCHAAGRALELSPGEPRAVALRAAARCPPPGAEGATP